MPTLAEYRASKQKGRITLEAYRASKGIDPGIPESFATTPEPASTLGRSFGVAEPSDLRVEIPRISPEGIADPRGKAGALTINTLAGLAELPLNMPAFILDLIKKPGQLSPVKEGKLTTPQILKDIVTPIAKLAAGETVRGESKAGMALSEEARKESFEHPEGPLMPALIALGGPKAVKGISKLAKRLTTPKGKKVVPAVEEVLETPKKAPQKPVVAPEEVLGAVGEKPVVAPEAPAKPVQKAVKPKGVEKVTFKDLATEKIDSPTLKTKADFETSLDHMKMAIEQMYKRGMDQEAINLMASVPSKLFKALPDGYKTVLNAMKKRVLKSRTKPLVEAKPKLTPKGKAKKPLAETPKEVVKGIKGERGVALNPFQEIADATSTMIEKAKTKPEIKAGVKQAKEAMIEHDEQIRSAEFTSKQFEKVVKDNIPKDKQMTMVHAYENKLKGKYWDELSPLEKKITEWAADEKAKLNQFIKDNDVLEMMESENINHIFHHWIDPKTGKPFEAMYSKLSKGLPQAKQRKIPTYEAGIKSGLKPATENLGKLIGLEWESVMRAHQSRQMFKTLHNIGAEEGVSIQLRTGKPAKPIRMVESWSKLQEQGLTENYTRYDHWALDKPITFKSGDRLVTIKGPVGVRNELFPFVKAYLENPTYNNFDKLNFAAKSLKLGFSMFHVVSLGMQELANFRVPFKNIPRGKRLIKNLSPELKILHQQGLDLWKGYEDLGYRNTFFEGATKLGKIGNIATKPIELMRSFIFDYVQPGMKASFAHDRYVKGLTKALKEGKTDKQWAREVVEMADGHFSHEHWKRSLLETNRFMVKLYFDPASRKWWQRALLSPTWQREHLLVAKNVAKSFMPDKMIKKLGLKDISKTAKADYRKYALGATMLIGSVNLYNLMMTKQMDGEAKHLWQNPAGKGFAVRAPWNEPSYKVTDKNGKEKTIPGGPAYIRPLKSVFEVAETAVDPVKKAAYKLSPFFTAVGRQLFPSRYQKPYEGIGDIPKRTLDFVLDVGTPIQASQIGQFAKGKKSLPSTVAPFFGMPSSKLSRKATQEQYYPRMARASIAGKFDEFKRLKKEFEGFGFKFDNKKFNDASKAVRGLKK